MRVLLLVVWMLIPVGALAFHMGPGQNQLRLNKVSQLLSKADMAAEDSDWGSAQELYETALDHLPDEEIGLKRKVRLQRAKMQLMNKELPKAHSDLKSLVDDLVSDENVDPKFLAEAQATLANSRYYITWLMRLEGKPDDLWQKEIDSAQQTYRMLARHAQDRGDDVALKSHQEDLESSIRLARMDLGELQGLPLPSQ